MAPFCTLLPDCLAGQRPAKDGSMDRDRCSVIESGSSHSRGRLRCARAEASSETAGSLVGFLIGRAIDCNVLLSCPS